MDIVLFFWYLFKDDHVITQTFGPASWAVVQSNLYILGNLIEQNSGLLNTWMSIEFNCESIFQNKQSWFKYTWDHYTLTL